MLLRDERVGNDMSSLRRCFDDITVRSYISDMVLKHENKTGKLCSQDEIEKQCSVVGTPVPALLFTPMGLDICTNYSSLPEPTAQRRVPAVLENMHPDLVLMHE